MWFSSGQQQQSKCGSELYVMAFTSGVKGAGSNDSPHLTLAVGTETRTVTLYDRPGDDMDKDKGDLWEFSISKLLLKDTCVEKADFKKITLENGGSNGWNIESIITFLRSGNSYDMLTADMHINRWLDSDRGLEYRQYNLKLV